MKKIFALLLAMLLIVSLTACTPLIALGQLQNTDKTPATEILQETEPQKNPALVAYLEKDGSALLSAMESSFATSSGMTCTSSIEVVDNGFEIYININELEDVPAETKALMQTMYDEMDTYWDMSLASIQTELPELEYVKVFVCEKDGDVLATITMD